MSSLLPQQANGSDKLFPPLLITGTGRCGTSIVAEMAHRLGIWMGARLTPADRTNPFGYFEDADFNDFFRTASGRDAVTNRLRFERLVLDRLALMRPWGVKNPKIADCLPIWIEYFPHARYVVCVREREETIASVLDQVKRWNREQAEALYDTRSAAIEEHIQAQAHLVLRFDEITRQPETTAKQLLEFAYTNRLAMAAASVRPREEVEKAKARYAERQAVGVSDDAGRGE